MKKLLLTLVVSLAFCGSIFAQVHSDIWETYWSDFNSGPFQMPDGVVAFVQIDGEFVSFDANWQDLEVGAFFNGECRGHSFLLDDDEHPYTEISVYRMLSESGGVIDFQLYDHGNEILYESCVTNFPVLQGDLHVELYLGDYENAIVLNFLSPEPAEGYTLEIDPYESDKDNYYLIASPVGEISASAVEGLRTPAFDFYAFDQSADLEWINLRDNEDFVLQPGIGYLYANNTGTDLVFNGTPVAEDVFEMDLDYDAAAGDFPGWNLVGNPFADDAYILCRDFYLLNGETFELMAQTSNTIVPAMTGAFVIARDAADYVTFSTQLGAVQCDEFGEDDKLILNVSKGRSVIDRAIVRFGEGRTLPKFQLRQNSTKVYIPMDGQDYAVVRSANQGEMPVNFKAESNGSYTLCVNAEANVNYLHLIDNLTGADQDLLANPSYTFEASTSDYASRFRLVFATGESDDTFAFASNGSFVISNEGNATVQVIDLNGRILSSETINGSASINVKAAAGVYMIRLINGDNVKVQKVVVK